MPNRASDVTSSEKLRQVLADELRGVKPRDSVEAYKEAVFTSVLRAYESDESIRQDVLTLVERVTRLERFPKWAGSKAISPPTRDIGEALLKGILDIAKGVEIEAEVITSLASLGLKSRSEVTQYFAEIRGALIDRFNEYATGRLREEELKIQKSQTRRNWIFVGAMALGISVLVGATSLQGYLTRQKIKTDGLTGQVAALESRTHEISVLKNAYLDLDRRFNALASNNYVQANTICNLEGQLGLVESNYVSLGKSVAGTSNSLVELLDSRFAGVEEVLENQEEALQKDQVSFSSLKKEIACFSRELDQYKGDRKKADAVALGFMTQFQRKLDSYSSAYSENEEEIAGLRKDLDLLKAQVPQKFSDKPYFKFDSEN